MKTKVIALLRDKNGMSRGDAEVAFETVVSAMRDVLDAHGELRAAPLGHFRSKFVPSRLGRNPATGEKMHLAATTRVKFTPTKS